MAERTVWAVASGQYSDYHLIAVFEVEDDAQALVDRLVTAGRGEHRDVYVVNFPFYPAGDRTLQPATYWTYDVEVLANGTLHLVESEEWNENPESHTILPPDNPPVPGVLRRWNGNYEVRGVGACAEQARKGAMDRAAWVATQVVQGVDPVEAQLTDEERAQMAAEAQAAAEATYERLKREAQVLAAREAEADRQWAVYLSTLEAALFSGIHNQISDWVPFIAPDLTPAEGFTGMVTHVQVRNLSGQIVLTHTERQEMEHGQRLPMPTWERPPLDRFALEER